MNGWHRYWSAPGGRIGAAVLRISIGTSLLWSLVRIVGHSSTSHSALYYPHGIWLAYPGRPSAELLAMLVPIAWVSTIAFTIGAQARVAHAISLVTMLALATFEVSGIPTWTHQNVPPLLASIAFLGARGGDALSVDALVRRARRQPALDVPGAYQWTLRLVQVAVASVFFVAACCKLANGGLGLSWALSDNLRNQLLSRFDWIHLPRTAIADWIIARPWRYETFALLNLGSQLLPMAAVVLVRRPIARAALGLVWVGEVVALGLVMALWDLHWLPLAAAFVDWDALVTARRQPRGETSPPAPRARMVFVAGFLAWYAAHAFALNQRLNLYPFSSYPMFAEVLAKRPYDQHQSYELMGGRIEVTGQRMLTDDEQRWIDRRIVYRWMWKEQRADVLRGELQGLLDETRRRFPAAGITTARIWLSVDRAPAYPAAARLERTDLAIIGELAADGTFRSALGELSGRRATVAPGALDLTGARLITYRDDLADPIDLAAERDRGGFTFAAPLTGDPVYVVAIVEGRPWLVARRSSHGS